MTRDVQQAYNERIAARPKRAVTRVTPLEACRVEAQERTRLNLAVQFRTRLHLTERKLAQVKNDLRYDPQSAYLRAEYEKLEKMYADLLTEKPQR